MLILLMANLIVLPVAIAFFNDDLSIHWIVFNGISDTVFLLDLIINFRTGQIFQYSIMLRPHIPPNNPCLFKLIWSRACTTQGRDVAQMRCKTRVALECYCMRHAFKLLPQITIAVLWCCGRRYITHYPTSRAAK